MEKENNNSSTSTSNKIQVISIFSGISADSPATKRKVLSEKGEEIQIKDNSFEDFDVQRLKLNDGLISNKILTKFTNFFPGAQYLLHSKLKPAFSKIQILDDLGDCFRNTQCDATLLILSGHGGLHENTKRSYLALATKGEESQLYYEDIKKLWSSKKDKNTNKYLLILLDSPHSGGWIGENLQENDYYDIFVQASCSASEDTFDFESKYSALIYNFVESNTSVNPKILKSGLNWPVSSGSKDLAKSIFGLNIIINDWSELENKVEGNNDESSGTDAKKNSFPKEISSLNRKVESDPKDSNYKLLKSRAKKILDIDIFKDYNKGDAISESMIKNLMLKYEDFQDPNSKLIFKKLEMESGAIAYGEYDEQNNYLHGRVIYVWKDGSKYDGYYYKGHANFFGKLVHADSDSYEGEWINDKAEGQGKYIHIDGTKYEGSWKNDKQEGFGKETWPDGAYYEGDYIGGKKSGKGTFVWADKSTYIGEFLDNKIHGMGKIIIHYITILRFIPN